MMEPTVGRKVYYSPAGADPGAQPHDATIVFVHSPRSVNLVIFNEIGNMYHATPAPLLQDDDAPPAEGGYAEWMPFQKGQASKTEATEGNLAARLDALEAANAAKLQELGDWILKKFADVDGRLTAMTTPPATPPAFVHAAAQTEATATAAAPPAAPGPA